MRGLVRWLAAALLGIAVQPVLALEPFKLLMPEPHGSTFRAIYAGIEKGWFKEEGLEIVFLPIPGGAINLVPQLAQGAGDIAWAGGYTVIQARSRGVPVVGINSASAESLWCLITHRESGIRLPADLKGKTIGVLGFSSATHFMAQALLRAGKLGEGDTNLRPIGLGGPALISQKQIDGYIWFRSQGMALQAKGAPVAVMDLDPHIPLPQDLMLATEANIAKRREAFKGYLRVLKRASDYGLDPKTTPEFDKYQAKYAPQTVQDTVYLQALNEETRERGERDRAKTWRWGSTDPKRLEAAQDFLFELKVIDRKTPVAAMYTDGLLP